MSYAFIAATQNGTAMLQNEIAYYRKLFTYDDWANRAHLDSLSRVWDSSDDRVVAARKAFNHVVAARHIWHARVTGSAIPTHGFYPTFALEECAELCDRTATLWDEFLRSRKEDDFGRAISFRDTFGNQYTSTLRDVLFQVLSHSAHHRGQTAILLRHAGHTPAEPNYYSSSMAKA